MTSPDRDPVPDLTEHVEDEVDQDGKQPWRDVYDGTKYLKSEQS